MVWFFDPTVSALATSGAYTLTCSAGSYTITGLSASLGTGRNLSTGGNSLVWSGASATLLKGFALSLSAGSYVITGQAASLTKTAVGAFSLPCLAGSFVLSGQTVSLKYGHSLVALPGAFNITGQAAAGGHGYFLALAASSYTIAGQTLAFKKLYQLQLTTASLSLQGKTSNLVYTQINTDPSTIWTNADGLKVLFGKSQSAPFPLSMRPLETEEVGRKRYDTPSRFTRFR